MKLIRHATIAVLIALFAFPDDGMAQRNLERGILLNPLFDVDPQAEQEGIRPAASFGGWAGFHHYAGVKDESHEWRHELGGFIELIRFNARNSLALTSQIEFIADPHNDIGFNPRSIFWEEGFLFTHQAEGYALQLGYYHRCKHDVDNLRLGEERTLIYGSISGRAITEIPQGYAGVKTEFYTIREDYTVPREYSPLKPDHRNLLGSIEVLAQTRQNLSADGRYQVYVRGFGMASVYSGTSGFFDRMANPESVYPSGGLSAGIAISDGGELRFGFDYEYLHDTGIELDPQGSHLLSFGVKAVDPSSIF